MPSSPDQRPGDDGIIAHSLPSASAHTTCPPEEIRQPPPSATAAALTSDGDAAQAPPRHVPRTIQDATQDSSPEPEEQQSAKQMEESEEAAVRDTPSPTIPQEERSTDQDIRLAQSMSATALSPQMPIGWQPADIYGQRVQPNSTSSFLRPGSRFVGTQQSDKQRYNVEVELKYVDMEQSSLSGYLRIQGLTDDHPTLTTFFEGEIIGHRHTFKTDREEWGSSEKTDMQHWARFPAWRPLAKQARSPSFSFKNFQQREHLFMRWKEYFLVPDHKVRTISGASFEGFYYICFNQCTGSVSGIYFHAKSEKYQQLELEHVTDRGCIGAVEFR